MKCSGGTEVDDGESGSSGGGAMIGIIVGVVVGVVLLGVAFIFWRRRKAQANPHTTTNQPVATVSAQPAPGGPPVVVASVVAQIVRPNKIPPALPSVPTQAGGSAPEGDFAERIQKVKQLLDEGIITQAEFEAKKAQILHTV